MYIFKAASLEQAREWAEVEPSVKTGMIVMRVHAWAGRLGVATKTAAQGGRRHCACR